MKKIFIAYGTSEGQTAKIADFISNVLRERGHEVTVRDAKDAGNAIPGGLGTDVTRDYVYTEWDGVRRFAEDFAAVLEGSTG